MWVLGEIDKMSEVVTLRDLGYMNGWHTSGPEYAEIHQCWEDSKVKQHESSEKSVGRCLTQVTCKTCGYVYMIDSSD